MIEPHDDVRGRIETARRVIEERLDEDVPLETLASAACYSMFHFHRLFRGVTGETVRQYARRLRLERAAHHLVHGSNDIVRIALDAGYDSHEAFTRAFKSRFGVTPSAMRDARRVDDPPCRHSRKEEPMDVRLEHRSPQRIACVRHVGPYDQVEVAWKTLMKWGWTKMLFGSAETFGRCFDDPEVTPAEQLRYEACMVVDAKAKPKARSGVEIAEMPGGPYAVALHEGAFQTIGATYAALFAQVTSSPIDGRVWSLGDPPSLERYLTDPRKTAPDDMRTEIWMPVQ